MGLLTGTLLLCFFLTCCINDHVSWLQVLCVLICVAGLRMGKAVINSFTAAKVRKNLVYYY